MCTLELLQNPFPLLSYPEGGRDRLVQNVIPDLSRDGRVPQLTSWASDWGVDQPRKGGGGY